jgi:hypothetical protein
VGVAKRTLLLVLDMCGICPFWVLDMYGIHYLYQQSARDVSCMLRVPGLSLGVNHVNHLDGGLDLSPNLQSCPRNTELGIMQVFQCCV